MQRHVNAKTLVIYTKEPHVGRVKTRLGRDIGLVASAWWFRHAARHLIRTLNQRPQWQTVVAVSPYTAVYAKEYEAFNVVGQGCGSLGARLRRTFKNFRTTSTVVIGTDCPDVNGAHIQQAFAKLGTHDVVLGPASDGGYWLIGIKGHMTLPLMALQNIRWSTEHTLKDTVSSFPKHFKIAYLETLTDVDTGKDLH